jgi:uncharacterized coiled-coil DUF342 family protein
LAQGYRVTAIEKRNELSLKIGTLIERVVSTKFEIDGLNSKIKELKEYEVSIELDEIISMLDRLSQSVTGVRSEMFEIFPSNNSKDDIEVFEDLKGRYELLETYLKELQNRIENSSSHKSKQ